MLHKHLLPTWLHPPNTQIKQDNVDQSKPTNTWQGRGTQPISRVSPLKSTRILLSAIPTQTTITAAVETHSPLRKDIPCQEAFTGP